MTRYKLFNSSPSFGMETPETFDTLEIAEAYRERRIEQIVEMFCEEAVRNALNELRQEAREAMEIEEIEEE